MAFYAQGGSREVQGRKGAVQGSQMDPLDGPIAGLVEGDTFFSASTQVANTRWTCSSLVVNQRSDWRQEVDDNRPIGACREHGLANAPQ